MVSENSNGINYDEIFENPNAPFASGLYVAKDFVFHVPFICDWLPTLNMSNTSRASPTFLETLFECKGRMTRRTFFIRVHITGHCLGSRGSTMCIYVYVF